jgi:hypothetical protein
MRLRTPENKAKTSYSRVTNRHSDTVAAASCEVFRTVTLLDEAEYLPSCIGAAGNNMKKVIVDKDDARDASLRVSKQVRDSLKAAAAVMGRPLYDVTNQAISDYLSGLKLGDPLAAIRRGARARRNH